MLAKSSNSSPVFASLDCLVGLCMDHAIQVTVLKSLSLNDHRPTSPMFNHRVKNRQEFAHASDQCNFGRFTSSTQSSVKFSDVRIAPTRHQCSHVERRTHRSPTTPYCATSSHHPAIPIQRCHTHQCSDLFSVELSQFRQLSQQRAADDGSDSRHTLEQGFLLAPDRTLLDALIKLVINSIKLRLQPPDMRLNSFAHRFSAMSKPIGFGRKHLGNLASPGNLRAQLFAGRRRQSSQRGPHRFSKVSQNLGINLIGLGQPTGSFGKVTHLAGIDHYHRQLGGRQCSHDPTFYPTGGFHHKQSHSQSTQPSYQLPDLSLLIRDRFPTAARTHNDIERPFGHVDSDKYALFHNPILLSVNPLQHGSTFHMIRAISPGNCSSSRRGRTGRPWLAYGLSRPRRERSVPSYLFRVCSYDKIKIEGRSILSRKKFWNSLPAHDFSSSRIVTIPVNRTGSARLFCSSHRANRAFRYLFFGGKRQLLILLITSNPSRIGPAVALSAVMTATLKRPLPPGFPVPKQETERLLIERLQNSKNEEDYFRWLLFVVAFYRGIEKVDSARALLQLFLETSKESEQKAHCHLALGQIATDEQHIETALNHSLIERARVGFRHRPHDGEADDAVQHDVERRRERMAERLDQPG